MATEIDAVPAGLTLAAMPSIAGLTIELIDRCASTNAELAQRAAQGAVSGCVLVAREQSAGRGRLGRPWLAPPGSGLTFSLLWRFAPATPLAGLPLAVGCACAEALGRLGLAVGLKWPNDLMLGTGKLGGILVELAGAGQAVIGIGINVRRPPTVAAEIAATVAFIDDVDASLTPVTVLAALLRELVSALPRFAARGLTDFHAAWLARAIWLDEPVAIIDGERRQEGRFAGIDGDGALLLADAAGRIDRILAGDVSLRPA